MNREALLLREAAEELGVSRYAVWRYIRDGLLRAVRVGPIWMILRRDLHAFQKPTLGRPRKSSVA